MEKPRTLIGSTVSAAPRGMAMDESNARDERPPFQGKGIYSLILLSLLVLEGCGLTPSPKGPLDFGKVYMGTSETMHAQWVNSDYLYTYEMIGVVLMGAPEFKIVAPRPFVSTNISPQTLSPAISYTFSPNTVGTFTTEAAPQTIGKFANHQALTLTGEGISQNVVGNIIIGGASIHQNSPLDFGNVPVGTTIHATFRIISGSNKAIALRGKWIKGSKEFSVSRPGNSFNLPPAPGKQIITLTFTPSAEGVFTDAIEFSDTGRAHIAGTAVKGTGVKGN